MHDIKQKKMDIIKSMHDEFNTIENKNRKEFH